MRPAVSLAALALAVALGMPGIGAAMGPVPPELQGRAKPKGGTQSKAPRPATGARDLPAGASEADVRRFCTKKYEEETNDISDLAGGAGGQLIGPALANFRKCLQRNGVTP